MAEYIQSEITLIHRVEASKPTDNTAPTSPSTTNQEATTNEVITNPKSDGTQEGKATRGIMRRSSVVRRLGNIAVGMSEHVIRSEYDNRIFQQQIIGNNRGASKIQQEKQTFNNYTNLAKQAVSTTVTASVIGGTGGLAIAGIFAVSQLFEMGYNYLNYQQQMQQFLTERELSMFESTYQRNRLNVNTYNRRR